MRLTVVPLAMLLLACSSANPPAPAGDPAIVASGTQDGVGYPHGGSEGPFTPLTEVAPSAGWGYSPEEPIRVGGAADDRGPRNQRLYLNALLGPQGEPIRYERRGSCCHFVTDQSPLGAGLLDVYEVTWEGTEEPAVLYLDMYETGELYVPQGLSARR
jgi:hypothetical protein